MSNLLTNGNFSQPTLTTNTFKYYSSNMTEEEKTSLYWTVENSSNNTMISLQNGVTTFGYANPSSISVSQFISFQYYSSIKQTVNVSIPGDYILKFNYTCRPGYLINPLKIYINDELIYVLTRYITTWSNFNIAYNVPKAGKYTIKCLTNFMDGDTAIAITKLSFIKSTNILKNSYFYSPSIFQNTYINVNNFYTPEMYPQFYWSYNNGTTGSINIANGITNYNNNGITSTSARVHQYIIIQNDAYIYQTVNCPVTGNYNILFHLHSSLNSTTNPIKFYIDDTLIYTLTATNFTSWSNTGIFASNVQVGTHIIKILGATGLIAISNIEMITPSTYLPPDPVPTGSETVSNNSFKSTKILGKFDVRPLLDISLNVITEGISTIVPKADTTALFIGDNYYYDTSTGYGALSITRPNDTFGDSKSRPHIGMIRAGRTVFQMGYLEQYAGYENYFGIFPNFGWHNKNLSNPAITFKNSNPSFIGINNINPLYQFDVSGQALFRSNTIINGYLGINNTTPSCQFDISGQALFRSNVSISGTTYNIQQADTCALFLGDNNVCDTHPHYGTLSITRPNATTGASTDSHIRRAHIACVREGDTIFQMGYCERFAGYQNNFGLFHNATFRVGGQPAITFARSDYNYIGINNINPTTNLDVSGNAIISLTKYGELKAVTISGTTTLSFPLNENIFCNCTTGPITLRLPNTAGRLNSTCTINIRRVSTGTNYINLQSYDAVAAHLINASNAAPAVTLNSLIYVNIRIQLYNGYYYVSSYQ